MAWNGRAWEFRWWLVLLLLVPLLFFTGTLVEVVPWPAFTTSLVASQVSLAELEAPEFVVCGRYMPCGTGRAQLELLRYAAARACEVADRGGYQQPVLLHVGEGISTPTAAWSSGIDLFSKVLAPLPQEVLDVVRLVFVEPSTERAELIRENMGRLPVEASRVQVLSAVVREDCTGDEELFRLSKRAERDFGMGFDVYGSWRVPTWSEAMNGIVLYAESTKQEQWLSFVRAANASSYVERVATPCLTPAKLLTAGFFFASSLAMVVVERSGGGIVEALLDLPLFQPGYLQFEQLWRHVDDTTAHTSALLARLKSRGFVVGAATGEPLSIAVSRAVSPLAPTGFGEVVKPEFAVCESPEPCGPPGSGWKYWDHLFQGVGLTAREVAAQGGMPVAMHIGSNTFTNNDKFIDADLHTRAIRSIPPALRSLLRIAFLDANPGFSTVVLQAARKKLQVDPKRVEFANAMVSNTCPSENALMYKYSLDAMRDFDVKRGVFETWMGPTKEYLVNVLGGFAERAKSLGPSVGTGWQALLNAPNRSAYITQVSVPCLSVTALADKLDIDLRHLVYVVIDAETVDHLIVDALLEHPGFKPGYLQFEVTEGEWNRETHQALVRKLQRRGYMVGKTYTKSTPENNAIAVPFNASLLHIEPSFSACRLPEPCGPSGVQWRHLPELLQNVRFSVQELEDQKLHAGFLQLGGQPMAFEMGPLSPMELHSKALELLPSQMRQSVRMLVVDPTDLYKEPIKRRKPSMQVEYFVGIFDAECLSKEVVMYSLSHQVATDFGMPWEIVGAWMDKSRRAVIDRLDGFATVGAGKVHRESGVLNKTLNFKNAWNRTSYIAEVRVPCLTFPAALSKAGVARHGLAMVVIRNNLGRQLVKVMLDTLPGFRPGFLQFQLDDWDSWASQTLLRRLQERGLAIGRLYPESSQLVAVRKL